MKVNSRVGYFAAFTAVFAVCAAYVFWGTWSAAVAPVMPDNAITHPEAYSEILRACWSKFVSSGRFVPSDVLWDGLFVSPYFCQELKYVSALYLSGLALAYFLSGRGLKPLAAYGAGLLLSFCGYWSTLFSAGHAGWFCWMTYGVFAFGLIDRALEHGKLRHWMLLGLVIAWGMFYQPDLWLMFTIFTAAYFLYRIVLARTFPWKGMLAAAVVFIAVGAPAIRNAIGEVGSREKQIDATRPAAEATGKPLDDRESRWIFVTNWSLPPDEIAEFFVPSLNGDTSCPLTLSLGAQAGTGVKPYTGAIGRPYKAAGGNYRQHSVYVGWVTCLLCLVGILSFKTNRREIGFFAVAAVFCCLLSLGRYFEPLYRCVFALPVGDLVRCPVKWHHLTEFSMTVLAGYGINRLLSAKRFENAKWLLPAVAAAVVFGAFDLAGEAHRFCAPVDMHEARRQDASFQMTFLPKRQFSDPQVASMVRSRRVVSLGYYPGRDDVYLVGVLNPRAGEKPAPLPDFGTPTALGVVSVLSSLAVIGCCLRSLKRS